MGNSIQVKEVGRDIEMGDWPLLIRSYRKDNGLKQDALAYILNVDQTTISRWERGIDTPSLAMQKRLRDLFWKREDSVLSAAVRMIKSTPARAAIVAPGTKIIEVSKTQAEHFGKEPQEMRGDLMRRFYGDTYYEQYMLPLAKHGIYSGEVSRLDIITKTNRKIKNEEYSHTSITPLLTASGVFAVSQSHFVSDKYAYNNPALKIYRFDELTE